MMKQCEQCDIYIKENDVHLWRDVCVVEGEEEYEEEEKEKERHYCLMYKFGIDDDIVSDKVRCKHFIPKNKSKR